MINLIRNRLLRGAIVFAALLIAGYLLLVNTAWGHTVDDAAYFGRKALARTVVNYGDDILRAVNIATLALAALIIFLVGTIRRSPLVAAIAVVGHVCAVAGAELLKRTLRWHTLVPTDAYLSAGLQQETYPSGHTTIGTSVAIALILVSSARWRPWLAMLAGFMSASFATGVFFAGWHRPSDALGGIVWSGFCMSMAAAAAVNFRGHLVCSIEHAAGGLIGSAALAAVVTAIAWLAAAGAPDEYPDADAPFLILTFLIIAGSFSVSAWFGWQLRGVDWRRAQDT